MYKKALRLKLRFETSKGLLTVEQLWDLPRTQLSVIVRNLKKKIKEDSDDDLAFLDDTAKQVDEIDQLMFEIAKDIYLTKKAEVEAAQNDVAKKQQLQELLAIKAERQKEAKLKMSDEDLEKQIADLSK